MIDLAVKITQDIIKDMKSESDRVRKACADGLKIAGYRHMRSLQKDLRQGRLGLSPLMPYRNKIRYSKRFPDHDPRYEKPRLALEDPKKPLKLLAKGIKYFAIKGMRNVEFGFLEGKKTRTPGLTALAEKHLSTFRLMVSDDQKQYLHKIGIHMKKRTSFSDVPGRDIVGRYLVKNRQKMEDDVHEYINAKLWGLQI